uniref:Uncharacterized protein n=1 Tax=Vespula pensylvanica TaxID=30213 RepID=A0A834K2N3_VESPE|nr:hypothetical protein H0235_016089 [Vespula pensylvanica]
MERYCVWGPVAPQGVLSSTIISASGSPPPFAQTTVVLTLDPSETLRLPERQWPLASITSMARSRDIQIRSVQSRVFIGGFSQGP